MTQENSMAGKEEKSLDQLQFEGEIANHYPTPPQQTREAAGRPDIQTWYKEWCKKTGRNGGVLIGSSIRELLESALSEASQQGGSGEDPSDWAIIEVVKARDKTIEELQAEIAAIKESMREVIRISDRKHAAWDKAKALLGREESLQLLADQAQELKMGYEERDGSPFADMMEALKHCYETIGQQYDEIRKLKAGWTDESVAEFLLWVEYNAKMDVQPGWIYKGKLLTPSDLVSEYKSK